MTPICHGCQREGVRDECENAFSMQGIIKVHWECWSACNLHCPFCYRTRDTPLCTESAMEMIKILRFAGVKWLVFAGGDPSLRPDIVELIPFAKSMGLMVEVQTNAESLQPEFQSSLGKVDQVGLSLDGPDATTHDRLRGSDGNFDKVCELISYLHTTPTQIVLRTVVTSQNKHVIPNMASLINNWSQIRRWSLLQFVPLGMGKRVRSQMEVSINDFENVVQLAADRVTTAEVDGFSNNKKSGVYALISASGELYGTMSDGDDLDHRFVGNLLTQHVSDLVRSLPFDEARHKARYNV